MDPIPVVCAFCGREGTISKTGEVEIRADVWKSVSIAWSPGQSAYVATYGELESDIDSWEVENAFEDALLDHFYCSECSKSAETLEEMVAPKYGTDDWGRVLDERGMPFGPMAVHPDQIKMAV